MTDHSSIDDTIRTRMNVLFEVLGGGINLSAPDGLEIVTPADGSVIASITQDISKSISQKANAACAAQKSWATTTTRAERAELVRALSAAIKEQRDPLATLITLEAGKTLKEAYAEVDGSADILLKTVDSTTLAPLGNMERTKERPPVGLLGLITSFNFPLAVANWNMGAALLAGNAVLWKPSEKTPLVALAYHCIFKKVAAARSDLLHIIVGGRDVGESLVACEEVDMISATGSVAMGKGIKATLAKKYNKGVNHILELGGNNGVVISDKSSKAHREFAVQSLMGSFLGTSGQRCTNTRRVFIHRDVYDEVCEHFKTTLDEFIASGVIQNPLEGESNDYGYGPLIDAAAYRLFDRTMRMAEAQGGLAVLGQRLMKQEYPNAYYVEPALVFLPEQTVVMQEETFGPLLFLVPYDGGVENATAMVNEPANSGLVSAIYTQSQKEADYFALHSEAGHVLINPPKGTGTPAHGMGFGGNKESGEGEILNAADPLQAFCRSGHFRRIASNSDITMGQ
jgi:aldehyde dehydrogenase (NAD+)